MHQRTPHRRIWIAAIAAAGLLAACAAPPLRQGTVQVKLIAFNDFHGNLRPPGVRVPLADPAQPGGVRQQAAGGVEAFSALVQKLRAENPLSAVVSAGDMVGASPLLSALFFDQPTIEAMNLVGVDLHAVGNHEFDRGVAHLKRLQAGGCEPDASTGRPDCGGRTPFAGARFPFLAANVIEDATGKPLFSPYAVKDFDGVKVAFIGLTLRNTPAVVRPAGTAGTHFLDEVETVNALVPIIHLQGIEAIVVLIHEGGLQSGGIDDCSHFSGDIRDIVERFDPAIQVVVSAHTHRYYICELAGKLTTSAGAFGVLLTDIDLTLDRASGKIVAKRARNLPVDADGAKDARLAPLLARYTELSAPLENRVVGRLTRPLLRREPGMIESELGNLIADAQLAGTAAAGKGGAEIAFNNQSSIRAAIVPDAEGKVSYGALFRAQPFQNDLVVMTLTGAQLLRALEHQLGADPGQSGRPLLLDGSEGFSYTWDATLPAGRRVLADSLRLNGRAVLPDRSYRVAVNSFLAGGSEGHGAFAEGTDRVVSALDLEALVEYMQSHSPYTPPPLGQRARRLH